jgi:hypothetical protein
MIRITHHFKYLQKFVQHKHVVLFTLTEGEK